MSYIVIIEQNELLRSLLVEWLTAEGYAVRMPRRAAGHDDMSVDLVIADLPAPRQDGLQTIRALQREFPSAPILAMSGSFRPHVPAEGSVARSLGARRVIAKPFHRGEMIEAVRSIIGPPQ